jgi:hypothetical protein
MIIRYVAEIRINPNPRFIDSRGIIIEKLLSRDLQKWQFSNDRIEVHGRNGFVFFTIQNLGFFSKEKPDSYIEHMKVALDILGERQALRWGFRAYTYIPINRKFSTLLNKYKTQLLNYSSSKFKDINGNLTDVGLTYVFKHDHNRYKIITGPMERDQAKDIFGEDDVPSTGIFIDLDIFREKSDFYGADDRPSRVLEFLRQSLVESEKIIKNWGGIINEG